MYSFGNDYFSSTCGFVIEGHVFCSRDDAAEFLVNNACMDPNEADTYLARLAKAFARNREVAIHG